MKKLLLKTLVTAALSAGTIISAAPAAQASCETEIGDMCKFMRAMCDSTEKTAKVRDLVINCDNW